MVYVTRFLARRSTGLLSRLLSGDCPLVEALSAVVCTAEKYDLFDDSFNEHIFPYPTPAGMESVFISAELTADRQLRVS